MAQWSRRAAGGLMIVLAAGLGGAGELDLLPLGDPVRALEIGSAKPGQLYDCNAGEKVELEAAVTRLAGARVVLLGEDHTSMPQKELQARLLDRLADGDRPVVLGMEFFQRGDDAALARWGSGQDDDEKLLLATGWYDRGGYRFDYYRTVMEVARRRGLRMVGLNIPRSIVRAVNRGGLESLTPEQRAVVGEVKTAGAPQHRYLMRRYFGESAAMMPPKWFDNMYAAQCVWDTAMARSIVDDLPRDGLMVVVVGAGHVAFDLGIARRIHEECARRGIADVEVASFAPVTAPPPAPPDELGGHPMGEHGPEGGPVQPPARFSRALADLVGVFADTGGIEAFPRLGVSLGEGEDDGATVRMVWPDSFAEAAGLESGDRIVDVNGTGFADPSHLRLLLARFQWGDRMDLRVARGEAQLSCVALLEPDVEDTETTLAPGFAVAPLSELDPAGQAPVGEKVAGMSTPELRRVLVSHDDSPLRVEVWLADALMVVHELDDAARVVRSVYREPLPDGAVEVRYERAPDGAVTAEHRYDRAGEEVLPARPVKSEE